MKIQVLGWDENGIDYYRKKLNDGNMVVNMQSTHQWKEICFSNMKMESPTFEDYKFKPGLINIYDLAQPCLRAVLNFSPKGVKHIASTYL